jgi:HAD superfamily hydrolase (TIGR01459 family)
VRTIDRLDELLGDFDAILCDIWGVVHDGLGVHAGVPEALRDARSAGLPVVLLSNVPRPYHSILPGLRALGLPDDAYDAVVTSGDVTRAELARRSPGPAHRLGRDTDSSLWEGLGLELSALGPARFIAIAGLRPGEHPDDYLPALRAARVRDLELVCANPDVQVPDGGQVIWAAGAVAQRYAGLGGRVVAPGKPDRAVYARAASVIERLLGRAVQARRILAIGDGIITDVRGANRSGLTCLFVASGLNGTALLDQQGQPDPELVTHALRAAGTHADFVTSRLH